MVDAYGEILSAENTVAASSFFHTVSSNMSSHLSFPLTHYVVLLGAPEHSWLI